MLMGQDSMVITQNEVQGGECSSPGMPIENLLEVQIRSPQGVLEDRYSSPLRKRPMASELVVEGPLTPPSSVLPPITAAKKVSFQEILQEVITDAQLEGEKGESSEMEFEAFFNGTIKPMAEDVNMKLAQEQLQDAESTLRVEVPPMDFSMNLAPWQIYYDYAGQVNGYGKNISQQRRLIQDINSVYEKDRRWPGGRRIDNDLKWAPFPVELGKVALNEVIQDDGSIGQYLADVDLMEVVDFDSLTWKPEGLQILRDDEELDEAELSQGPPYQEQDLQPLLGKRGLNTKILGGGTSKRIKTSRGKHVKGRVQSRGPPYRDPLEVKGGLLLGDHSTATALETFMRLRGVSCKAKALPLASITDRDIGGQSGKDGQPLCPNEIHPTEILECEPQLPPMPVLTPPAGPRPFVISSALLTQRRLLRRIQGIYPDAVFIERDFALQRIPVHNPLRGASRAAVMGPIDEADLIVSPSVGVIWTTMQKIKQRPLPGQSQKPGFREKIAKLSQRYERLIVLVSEGRINNISAETYGDNSWPTEELNEKDCDALVELMGFAAASSDEIAIMFAGGGEEELAKWIVALMVKYGTVDQEAKLLQDETQVN
jgi:hypothetical protein